MNQEDVLVVDMTADDALDGFTATMGSIFLGENFWEEMHDEGYHFDFERSYDDGTILFYVNGIPYQLVISRVS